MPNVTVGATSAPFDVDIGQTVTVTPGSGGTMLVEYTTDGEVAIRNGSATWQAWTAGTVSAATSDVCLYPLFARVTAYAATGVYTVSGSGNVDVPSAYVPWKRSVASARDLTSSASIVGAGTTSRLSGAIWCPAAGGYSGGGPATRTWQHILAAPSKFYAVRVGYKNPLTSTITIDKTNITASTTYVASGDPTGGATPVNVLFSGSASVTLAAAASVAEETITMSDWTAVAPLAWTGVTNGRALAYIRSYIALSGYTYISQSNLANYPDNVVGGMIRQASFANGDYIATPTGFVGTGSNAVGLPMVVEFRDISGSVRIASLGDSTYNCSTFTDGGQFNNWGEQACRYLNAIGTRYYSFANFGWASQSLATYAARLPSILTANKYDVVVIQTFSPNSAPSTQAGLDADINRVLDMIAQVRTAGAIPILSSGIPAVALNSTTDALRKQSNTTFSSIASAMRIQWVDIDSSVSDGASPARLLATVSSDGTHLTTALGQQIMRDAIVTAISKAVP